MLFFFPFTSVLTVYAIAALGPAIFLMYYIYKQDKVEPEPGGLLWACVGRGVLAALCSIILEMIGQRLLGISRISQDSVAYTIILAFAIVAVAEEGMKYFFLYRRTWRDPNFNYRFDGIVYAAFVSLGFAAFENVEYVLQYGLSVALPRAVLSIPGHLGFSVVFGYFYGRAKLAADMGHPGKARANIIAGYLLAVFLHGTYDSCAMIRTQTANTLFIVFVVVMYIVIFRLIRKESRTDRPV